MFTPEIRQCIEESVLCWLATVDASGLPNVSPKEMFLALSDNQLVIANIASPQSVKNIENHASVCVSMVNVFKQKGFKFKGTATNLLAEHESYHDLAGKLHELGGRAFPIQSIILVSVSAIEPIIAPSYWMFDACTESEKIHEALRTYKVTDYMSRA